MDKDSLYNKYLQDNANILIEFDGIKIDGRKVILIFYGKDIYDNEIRVEQDLQHHRLGNRIISSLEEFNLGELEIDEYVYAEIYVKPKNERSYIDLYDWL